MPPLGLVHRGKAGQGPLPPRPRQGDRKVSRSCDADRRSASVSTRGSSRQRRKRSAKKKPAFGPAFFVQMRRLYFFISLAVSLASIAEPLASVAEPFASLAASIALSADFMASGEGAGAGVTTTAGGEGAGGGVTTTGAGLSHAARTATTATAAKIDLF